MREPVEQVRPHAEKGADAYWLERAWLPDGWAEDVLVTVHQDRFTSVRPGVRSGDAPAGAHRRPGLTIPGLANCHSHVFHRALRGRTQARVQAGAGSFWTWRDQMYRLADRLDPDTFHELAVAVYRELAATGITSVGEFHYLHNAPGGTPYDEPNVMGRALVSAAEEAGLAVAVLDACYLAAGIGRPPEGVQLRFSDGTAERWAERVDGTGFGSAIHSVRAVPRDQLPVVAARPGPLHVHLSEQTAENEQSLAAYGRTPTQLLDAAGALGERTTVVHATHLATTDIATLGGAGVFACLCPTTERDLGDGIGPSVELRAAGARLTLGSDSHAVVDLFEEMRAVELHERLRSRRRGHWAATELLAAATVTGHESLGFAAGRIEPGARADLVTIDPRSPRTAGTGADEHTAVFAATAADVVAVVSAGTRLDLDHQAVGAGLDRVIRRIWADA